MAAVKNYNFLKYFRGKGLEIGALHKPLLAGGKEVNVAYVDISDKGGLIRHNPEIAAEDIKEPDIIADAQDLSAIPCGHVDFIIANHVLEHLPNPIKALKEFSRVLKAGGILYLAVPDKRYSFDKDRALTSLEHLLNDYKNSADLKTSLEHYREWFSLVESKKHQPVAANLSELLDRQYRIHFHVWRPGNIVELLGYLGREFKMYFNLEDYYYRKGDVEAVFILRKTNSCLKELPVVLKEKYSVTRWILNRQLNTWSALLGHLKSILNKIYPKLIRDYSFTSLIAAEINNNKTILDIGCGRASIFKYILNKNYKIGLDIYEPYLMKNRISPVHNGYVLADCRALPFKNNSFSCSIAMEVLEHLSKNDGVRMLSEMERVSSGKIILTTPNGFLPVCPGAEDNPDERHRCGWGCPELAGLGFKVYGINSLKILWAVKNGQAVRKFKIGKTIFLGIVFDIIRMFAFFYPAVAFQLLLVKEKSKPG